MRSRCLSRWVARAVISALGSLLPAAVSSYPSDDDRMLSVGRRPRWPFSISGSIAAGSQRPAPPRDRGTPVSRLQPSPRLVRFTARVRATRRLVRQGDVLPSRVRTRDLDERARGGTAHLPLRRSAKGAAGERRARRCLPGVGGGAGGGETERGSESGGTGAASREAGLQARLYSGSGPGLYMPRGKYGHGAVTHNWCR